MRMFRRRYTTKYLTRRPVVAFNSPWPRCCQTIREPMTVAESPSQFEPAPRVPANHPTPYMLSVNHQVVSAAS
jgi:hypothetical protein